MMMVMLVTILAIANYDDDSSSDCDDVGDGDYDGNIG